MNTEIGRPICVFWYNMRHIGIHISVNDTGQLSVRAEKPNLLTDVVKQEIENRAALLVDILDNRQIPHELSSRLIPNALHSYDNEVDEVMTLGTKLGYMMSAYLIQEDWYVVAKCRTGKHTSDA